MMPGVIYDDLVIVGSAPGENYFSPPGYVRAYNVVTGKLEWTFHTIPHPGEFGYDTWPKDAYKYVGAVNVWSEMTVDEERGIVYLPLGSPTYDYYGADREGSNLLVIALWRWARQENVCGIIKQCIMIFGIMICLPLRNC